MSIFGKLFKKKDDDFSFDTNDSGFDSFSSTNDSFQPNTTPNTTPSFDSFSNQQPSSDPFSTLDSFSNSMQNTPNTTGMPQRNATSSAPPLPPMDQDEDMSRGTQIARDYLRRQETQQTAYANTPQSTSSSQDNTLEVINLKLDAIRSQLETLNHRIEKLENGPKRLWK